MENPVILIGIVAVFIEEIKSLKRIIRLSKEKKPIISFIDEILISKSLIQSR